MASCAGFKLRHVLEDERCGWSSMKCSYYKSFMFSSKQQTLCSERQAWVQKLNSWFLQNLLKVSKPILCTTLKAENFQNLKCLEVKEEHFNALLLCKDNQPSPRVLENIHPKAPQRVIRLKLTLTPLLELQKQTRASEIRFIISIELASEPVNADIRSGSDKVICSPCFHVPLPNSQWVIHLTVGRQQVEVFHLETRDASWKSDVCVWNNSSDHRPFQYANARWCKIVICDSLKCLKTSF